MKKSELLELIRDEPEELDIDKLIYTLWFRRKIERAEAASEEDDILHDEVERLSEEWSR